MEHPNKKYFENRAEWRKWLAENFETAKELWMIFPKKTSEKKRITYNDAVEEALCFGWIDSVQKTLDENNTIQRFSPRKPKSSYSQINIERLKNLAQKGMLHPKIESITKEIIEKKFIFPEDIIKKLKSEKEVWENYQKFSDSYKRIRISYIDGARDRPEEFEKRLNNFIEKTRQNKLITGYGGLEYYYL
ncbi:MAG: YdeI/OmpD-associated family protein [Candidatus Kapabacteria bacterium]|jgi:uncharacterized protein YdeI (YjbR/CyaY-like superfamily)|nr:YdeI/OmpD-associated family protein [Candidatus Kapabacteria bacterium]